MRTTIANATANAKTQHLPLWRKWCACCFRHEISLFQKQQADSDKTGLRTRDQAVRSFKRHHCDCKTTFKSKGYFFYLPFSKFILANVFRSRLEVFTTVFCNLRLFLKKEIFFEFVLLF